VKKSIVIILGIILFYCPAFAQVYSKIGQFQTLQMYYNPAAAGAATSVRANVMYRSQWNKFPGAPVTYLATIDAPLARNLGGGLVAYSHVVGKTVDVSINLNASYRIKTGVNSYFQFGLKAGVSMINNGGDYFKWDENDNTLNNFVQRGNVIRIGPGVYYKRKNLYVGLSSPDAIFLDPQKVFLDNSTNKTSLKRNFIFMAGTKKNLSEFIAFQPNVMITYYAGRPMDYYLNLGFEFNQTFTAGVGLSYPMGYGIYTRVAVSPKLKLGFRYEFGNKSYQVGNYGTTEVMLSYGFN
jgi:type IX secretion system PorP/SprF family membrane protein